MIIIIIIIIINIVLMIINIIIIKIRISIIISQLLAVEHIYWNILPRTPKQTPHKSIKTIRFSEKYKNLHFKQYNIRPNV